jgi:hypothetical protein
MAIKEIIIIEAVVLVFLAVALVITLAIRSHKKARAGSEVHKEWKLENWIILIIYLAGGLFLVYILGSVYLPEMFEGINSGDYSINLDNPTSALSALRFSKDIFGDVMDGSVLIESEEIVNLIFKPKIIIEEGREATLLIEGKNLGTEVYFDGKLIIPDLSDYTKIKDFDDSEVWVKDDLTKSSYVQKSSVEDFVYFNFPGASVYSFKELDEDVPTLNDWNSDITEIDTTFRDNLKLAVYHGGGYLNIRFTKQDLNNYVGKDEYTLSIIDFGTGMVVYTEVFEDDEDKKDTKVVGEEDDYELNLALSKGIYYLDFKKDGNNPSSDSTLKDIRIGSNKVLIVDRMLVYEEDQDFFTKANEPKEIEFYYWWGSKDQHIYFSGSSAFTENIDEDWKSKDYVVELEEGHYNFNIEKGYIWVKGDAFSASEDSWFDLPVESEARIKNSNDVLITDKEKLMIGNAGNINITVPFEIDGETSSHKFQVIDKDMFSVSRLEVLI